MTSAFRNTPQRILKVSANIIVAISTVNDELGEVSTSYIDLSVGTESEIKLSSEEAEEQNVIQERNREQPCVNND
jgi:hypothetical protein